MKTTKQWFEEAVPNPTFKNLCVQTGVHLEEILEMVDAIKVSSSDKHPQDDWNILRSALRNVSEDLKTGKLQIADYDAQEVLDSLCDQKVTATGVGHMMGFNMDGATAEVDESNFSKFVDGKAVFDQNGKIAKGPYYFKPNLAQFLGNEGEAKTILRK